MGRGVRAAAPTREKRAGRRCGGARATPPPHDQLLDAFLPTAAATSASPAHAVAAARQSRISTALMSDAGNVWRGHFADESTTIDEQV